MWRRQETKCSENLAQYLAVLTRVWPGQAVCVIPSKLVHETSSKIQLKNLVGSEEAQPEPGPVPDTSPESFPKSLNYSNIS